MLYAFEMHRMWYFHLFGSVIRSQLDSCTVNPFLIVHKMVRRACSALQNFIVHVDDRSRVL